MAHFIDRRLNGKNKSAVNRQRFIRRYKKQIKQAVSDAVSKRSIQDVDKGESISIPTKDIGEPHFHQGQGGKREMVHPGNDQFVSGDKIDRPKGGRRRRTDHCRDAPSPVYRRAPDENGARRYPWSGC